MSPFWCPITLDVVDVSGADAATFLQSQLSQNLTGLTVGQAVYSFVLQPAGKLDALVRVRRVAEDRFVLDSDAGTGVQVAARLNRFKIRVAVTIEASTVEVIAVRNAPGVLAAPDAANAVPAWGRDDAFDLFPPAQPPEGIERGDSATLTLARIEAGWPATGAELTEATIPAETGFVVGLAVSFTKGCYPGQELVERMDSRGSSAPRTIRRLRGSGSAAVGDPVVGADGKIVGHLSSVAATADGRGDGWVALVPLARSVEVDADGAATTTLTVGGLPAVVEPANVNTVP